MGWDGMEGKGHLYVRKPHVLILSRSTVVLLLLLLPSLT